MTRLLLFGLVTSYDSPEISFTPGNACASHTCSTTPSRNLAKRGTPRPHVRRMKSFFDTVSIGNDGIYASFNTFIASPSWSKYVRPTIRMPCDSTILLSRGIARLHRVHDGVITTITVSPLRSTEPDLALKPVNETPYPKIRVINPLDRARNLNRSDSERQHCRARDQTTGLLDSRTTAHVPSQYEQPEHQHVLDNRRTTRHTRYTRPRRRSP